MRSCVSFALGGYLLLSVCAPVTGLRPPIPQHTTPSERSSVCQTETFQAECADDEVIVMTSARYGRMSLGRCVELNMGYLGCYSDVIGLMDGLCSGRQRCSVHVPHPLLEATKPCLGELRSYIDASYACLTVFAPMNSCEGQRPVKLTRTDGYLSSHVALTTGCSLETSPWLLMAKPGQHINVTFYDFSTVSLDDSSHSGMMSSTQCDEVAFISDPQSGQKVKLCPGYTRDVVTYTSVGNSLEVTFRTPRDQQHQQHFVVHFQVIGCADKAPPTGMTYTRTSLLAAVLKCVDSDLTSELLCVEGDWLGMIQNCTPSVVSQPELGTTNDTGTSTSLNDIMLVCLIGICIVIGFVVIGTAAVCIKRLNRQNTQHYYQYPNESLMHACTAGSKYSLRTMHVDSAGAETPTCSGNNVIYGPLLSRQRPSNTPATQLPQAECLLCQGTPVPGDRAYKLVDSDDDCCTVTSQRQAICQIYPQKQSNIRNNLSLKLDKSLSKPKKLYNTATPSMKCDILSPQQQELTTMTSPKRKKSYDGDVILQDLQAEPRVLRQTDEHDTYLSDTHHCMNSTL